MLKVSKSMNPKCDIHHTSQKCDIYNRETVLHYISTVRKTYEKGCLYFENPMYNRT